MKHKLLVGILTAIAACAQVPAQTAVNQNWVGVWQAQVDGQPTDTLTLAMDTGALGGTIVLDMVSERGGTPHVIAREPHVLLNPHLAGNTLSFQVKMTQPGGPALLRRFTVLGTSPGKLQIHCVDCGPGALQVELIRDKSADSE